MIAKANGKKKYKKLLLEKAAKLAARTSYVEEVLAKLEREGK